MPRSPDDIAPPPSRASGPALPERPWASPSEAVLDALGVTAAGLTDEEADRRRLSHGVNALAEEQGARPRETLLRQFHSPLISVLLVAGLVTVALGEWLDAGLIVLVVAFNAVVGFLQEYRAERSLEALRQLARAQAHVLRGGREREIDATELVPGDVVLVEAGDRVPADCRIIHATSLEADESLLTGESATVGKAVSPVAEDAPVADRRTMLHMGSVITRGHGRAVASATGPATELGGVAGAVQRITDTATPLQRAMGRFGRLIGVAVLAGSLLGFALGAVHGEPLTELLHAAVALAVAALPEGLPIVLTITLAISVGRMARRGAIIRRLPAVETLGCCTIIGSDKTGTLTQNRMTVEEVFGGGERFTVTGTGYRPRGEILAGGEPIAPAPGSPLELTLRAGALANDAALVERDGGEPEAIGDPTEIALLASAGKAELFKDDLEERCPRRGEIPFSSERRFAATFNEDGSRVRAYVKGAPEQVLAMCVDAAGVERLDRAAVLAEADRMAARGLRVLAMASRDLGPADERSDVVREHPDKLTFLGLQGMMDPPREEARVAVARCREAGIRTVMITGDHGATATAIARELGIAGPGEEPVTGRDLDGLDEGALARTVDRSSVFARVSPEHKLRIVEALQRQGHVVAVTGDGVNDAPALKQADIGAAMGRSGTDVAKEAADMVLTDDNFATIVAAVEEGRVAFDNVRKTAFFLISGNAAAVLAVLVSLGAGLAVPFVAVQLLWLNLVTSGVQDLALAFEPAGKRLLERPPRPRAEGIISRLLWERTVIAALVMAAGTLAMFELERSSGATLDEARTVALTTMVVFQALHVGNARSAYASAFAKSPLSNPFLLTATVAALAIHVAALYVPFTQFALHLEPIDLGTWIEIVAVAFTVIVAVELHKLVRARRPVGTGGTGS